MKNLPVFEPYLLGTEGHKIQEALNRGEISGTSPIVGQFEERFAAYAGRTHAVAIANGTVALHAALLGLEVKPGDEIIIPDMTIISNALAAILAHAEPVFADVSPRNWCLEPKNVEALITPKTVGIMAVHMYGQACDMDALQDIARRHQLWLLEDAAQAMGGYWNEAPLGSLGTVSTYSFFANKLITMGEGGAIGCNDRALAEKLKVIRNLSFNPMPEKRFEHLGLTNNYRLSGIQAAMGLAQLEQVKKLEGLREKIRMMYQDAFAGADSVHFPVAHPSSRPAYWMEVLQLNDAVRISIPELQEKLKLDGIDSRRFFFPLHRQTALHGLHHSGDRQFPVADRLFERGIYLPCSSHLVWDDIRFIASKVLRHLK